MSFHGTGRAFAEVTDADWAKAVATVHRGILGYEEMRVPGVGLPDAVLPGLHDLLARYARGERTPELYYAMRAAWR